MLIGMAQFAVTERKEDNLAQLVQFVRDAGKRSIRLVVAPEASMFRSQDDSLAKVDNAERLDGPFVSELVSETAKAGTAVAFGMFIPSDVDGKVFNALVIVDRGEVKTAYLKLHLYDAFTGRESDRITAGNELPPVVEFDGVKVGFATCYDLRFPELFRKLVDKGATVLSVSAAWVRGPLKEEHWATLLRSRAIENTAYMVASGEAGDRSIGRSVAYDPLGAQMLDLAESERALGVVEIETGRIDEVRRVLPALKHRRLDVGSTPRDPVAD